MQITGLPLDVPGTETIEQELAEYEIADFIAVPSAFASDTFVRRGISRTKLLVNPYGVDLSLFSMAESRSARNQGDPLRVLHVGRVSARKGVHYLADAVSRVRNARLTLVGAVEHGIQKFLAHPSVSITGAIAGRQLPQLYREADVFCLLSVEEGLALVVAQAMAMGLPVVATPNTGAEELIEDGVHGFLVPARDSVAAAARLQQLADDESLRREMGERARARIANGFDWAHYGDRASSLYEQIVGGAGSRSIQ
jgi:glycosyltransferase involved in cell wall biosynthesis